MDVGVSRENDHKVLAAVFASKGLTIQHRDTSTVMVPDMITAKGHRDVSVAEDADVGREGIVLLVDGVVVVDA
jgi:hypothetical protein